MHNINDIRWKQRLYNYDKALSHLASALQIEKPDMLQKAGIIQFFEMSFELAWKMVRDYLAEQGFSEINSPRASIKTAFEAGIIKNGHGWIDLIVDRNLTTHTYDEQKATELQYLIQSKYYPLMDELLQIFKEKD